MGYQDFEALLKSYDVTVYQVAKATGIGASTFTDWKRGRSTPKTDKLARIADYFSVSLDELMGTESGQRKAAASYQTMRAHKQIPVIGVIHAGSPIVTNETVLGYEFADVENVDEYFYFQICDDSMKNCGIMKGSRVLFHKQQNADSGDVVACLTDHGTALVKRFQKQHHRILLTSENEMYKPITLTPEDFETGRARIFGVAVEVKTKL